MSEDTSPTVGHTLRTAGLLAQYDTPGAAMNAAERVRDAGYTNWDVHTPFPVHGMDGAMGLKPTPVGFISLAGGMTGGTLALLMQWWMNGYDYPLNIGGKPAFAIQTSIPVTFELTILLTAFFTLFGMLGLNRLPTLYHWVFNSRKFERVTDDRFFISIDAEDPKFNRERTRALLERTRPLSLEEIEEEAPGARGTFKENVGLTVEAIAGISSPFAKPGAPAAKAGEKAGEKAAEEAEAPASGKAGEKASEQAGSGDEDSENGSTEKP
jgi:hypothetical protein